MNAASPTLFAILMIDDNSLDAEVMRRALAKAEVSHEFLSATNGRQGIDLLREDGSIRPSLVLLDLNMPIKDGFEVLGEVKQDPELKKIPIIVYTSSSHQGDVDRCYSLHANSFVVKPMSFAEVVDVAKSVYGYWVRTASLPN